MTFRYNRTPTGELPGNSLITQTEAALSALGQETYDAKQAAEQAAADAAAAAADAEAAQGSAASAAADAQQAAESAAQVVSVAQQALTVAQRAEVTAGRAETAAGQAAQSASDAKTAAQGAASNAQTAAGLASQSAQDAQTAQGAASASQTAAQSAQTSAGQAATIATQAQSAAAQSAQAAAQAAAAVGASARQIGEIVSSTLPITSAGLHLLDGALINGSGIYADFVTYIGNLYTADPTAAYFTNEAAWQSSITNYGVCGKFVFDSVNNTVRLPKITGITEGTTDLTALGDLVEAGLPNITGNLSRVMLRDDNFFEHSGVFSNSEIADTAKVNTSGSYGSQGKINFDASRSNSIYGNSSTVQPQSIKVLFYIVVATVTKTEIQVDIDNVVTELNRLDSVVSHVAPVGSYVYYAGGSVPDHYLLCNGAAVSRSEYADLFNVIGTTYGNGDGSTTFNLPNLIDKFLEGSGTSGTEKAAGLPNISGSTSGLVTRNTGTVPAFSGVFSDTLLASQKQGASGSDYYALDHLIFDASDSDSIYGNSSTVQPPALTALPCIRYE